MRHTYLSKYRTRKEKKLKGNTRKGSSGCPFRLWRFLADHTSGLAIFKVLCLSSLVGLTIMYSFISSEILACSYSKILGKIGYIFMYVRTVPFEPSFCQAYTQLTDQPTTRLMGSHSRRGT